MTDSLKKGETARVSPWIRVQTGLLAGIALLLTICVILLCGSVSSLNRSLDLVQEDLEVLQMDHINKAIDALTEAAAQLSAVDTQGLNRTAEALKAAAEQLAVVDIEGLNKAVASLKEAANTLKKLDVESFNGIIQSLNNTAESLKKVGDTIGGIFGR